MPVKRFSVMRDKHVAFGSGGGWRTSARPRIVAVLLRSEDIDYVQIAVSENEMIRDAISFSTLLTDYTI